jgi:hypothetical protein
MNLGNFRFMVPCIIQYNTIQYNIDVSNLMSLFLMLVVPYILVTGNYSFQLDVHFLMFLE